MIEFSLLMFELNNLLLELKLIFCFSTLQLLELGALLQFFAVLLSYDFVEDHFMALIRF
jgi:hypothetical protein